MRERFKLGFHFNDRLHCFQVFFSLSSTLQNLNTVAITSKKGFITERFWNISKKTHQLPDDVKG